MKKTYKYIILLILSVLLIILFIKSAMIREIAYLVVISFIIAYSIKPFHRNLVSRGLNRRISAVLLLIIFVALIAGALVMLIPSIFREGINIGNSVSKVQAYCNHYLDMLKPLRSNKTAHTILNNINEKINVQVIAIFNKVFDNAVSMGESLISFAVMPIIVYYFLADGELIKNKVLVYFPAKGRSVFKKIMNDIDKILSRYIISQFLLCALIGVLTFIVLIMLHVNMPVILSLLNAVFNIIPYFGPLFGALPCIVMALLVSPKVAIYTAILLYLIQQIEGDIISPKITGDSVSMHPLLVILLLVLGGKVGGFIGMVLAVPVGVIIKVIYEDLNYYLF